MEEGSRLTTVGKNCYSTLTRAISAPKTAAPHVARVVLESWVIPYDIPNTIVTGSGPQLVSKFFAIMCTSMSTKLFTTTEYHSQAYGQVKRSD